MPRTIIDECDCEGRREVGVQAWLQDAILAGGCNFCTRVAHKVWVIRGHGRNVEVRACPTCMRELRAITARA